MSSFLIVQHAENCPPGRIQEFLGDVQVLKMWETPQALESFVRGQTPLPDGVVVLGGTQSAYSDTEWPWLPDVRALLRRCYEESVPTLGVCLGMQLAAVAGGGTVSVNATEGSEVGVTQIFWNSGSEDGLARALSSDEWVYADHADAVVDLPRGAVALARSEKYVHAMRWGSVIGVQYHPEVTPEIVTDWLDKDAPVNAREILSEYMEVEVELAQHCQALCCEVLQSGKQEEN